MRTLGGFLFLSAGFLMWVFWMGALLHWLGGVGVILGVVFAPGVVIFPVIFWMVEGVLPAAYLALWVVGLLGAVLFASSDSSEGA